MLHGALYALYLTAFVLLVLYLFFYRGFVAELRNEVAGAGGIEALGPIDPHLMRHIGSFRNDKLSSMLNHRETKPEGQIRVCAFGDSYTYGGEVGPDQDYPTILQRMFDDAGLHGVQVLNFGSPWHGFHQTYVLWSALSERFGCDVTLLGPGGFFSKRDTTFNHTDLLFPSYLHARFVLEGDDVELVSVVGDTPRERFEEYFRFFPRWRYLRFDRNAPMMLQAVVSRNRSLRNPFYYRLDERDDEAHETYRILLRRMAARMPQTVLVHNDPEIVALGRQLDLDNLLALPAFDKTSFPYRAPRAHNSVWANQQLARQIFSVLVGEVKRSTRVISYRDVETANTAVAPGGRRPLQDFTRLDVGLERLAVGALYRAESGMGGPDVLHGTGVASMLAVTSSDDTLLEAALVPVPFELRSRHAVRLALPGEAEGRLLGHARLVDEGVNLGVVSIRGLSFVAREALVPRPGGALAGLPAGSEVRLDGRAVLRAKRRADTILFEPIFGELYKFSALPHSPVSPAELPASGELHLRLSRPGNATVVAPLATWSWKIHELPWGLPARQIAPRPDGGVELR